MDDAEKERIVAEYCDNEMAGIKHACYPLIEKIGGLSPMDYDDLYSLAQWELFRNLDRYDVSKGASFKTFIVNVWRRKFSTYIRDKNTQKRSNTKRDESGEYTFVPDVSLEANVYEGLGLANCLPGDAPEDDGTSENVQSYIESLSDTGKQIARLITSGYDVADIKNMLGIPDNKWKRIIASMSDSKKRDMIKRRSYGKEKNDMSENVTTMEKSKSNRLSVASIIKKIENYSLRFDHPLQRESGQWTLLAKSNLISDVLQGNPIPALIFAEQIANNMAIIWNLDGKQRCMNVKDYIYGDFKISRNVERYMISYPVISRDSTGKPILDDDGFPMSTMETFDIRNKAFSDLPEELRDRIMDYNFEIIQYLNCDAEDIAYHIKRHNAGRPMSIPQKGMLNIGEKFASMVKAISAMPFFEELGNYRSIEKRNGAVDRVVVESVMSMNFLDDWKKEQAKMYEFIRDNATSEVFDNFEDVVERISNVATDETLEMFNSKNSFIWFGVFGRFVNTGLPDGKFIEFMTEFSRSLHSTTIDGESYDNLDQKTGTKDKSLVVAKIEKLTKLMEIYFGTSCDNEEISDVDFIKENVVEDTNEEDVELYNDILEECVRLDSDLYKRHKTALLGMVAYSCQMDQDSEFERWIRNFKGDTLPQNEIKAFDIMKRNFDAYLRKIAAA